MAYSKEQKKWTYGQSRDVRFLGKNLKTTVLKMLEELKDDMGKDSKMMCEPNKINRVENMRHQKESLELKHNK